MLQDTAEREEIIAGVAALDIGKAELVCCVRVGEVHAWGQGIRRGEGRAMVPPVTETATWPRSLVRLRSRLEGPPRPWVNATVASPADAERRRPSSPSADPSWSSSGTCCPSQAPTSSISVPTTTTPTATPATPSATTSVNSKPSGTKSPSNPRPDAPIPGSALAPPGAAACLVTNIFVLERSARVGACTGPSQASTPSSPSAPSTNLDETTSYGPQPRHHRPDAHPCAVRRWGWYLAG